MNNSRRAVIRALILTHGSLGRVLLDSVEKVLGPQANVEVLSNEGTSLEQLVSDVEHRLGEEPAVLFVDFFGGSPFVACRCHHEKHGGCALLSGVNMPMLISFFTKRDQLPFTELVATVQADGLRGIQLLTA